MAMLSRFFSQAIQPQVFARVVAGAWLELYERTDLQADFESG
jgi:hypothetical protein